MQGTFPRIMINGCQPLMITVNISDYQLTVINFSKQEMWIFKLKGNISTDTGP